MHCSVVVPFHNEALNLTKLIEILCGQSAANLKVEFIFVDDHSTDNWEELITEIKVPADFRFLKNKGRGKKQALQTAFSQCDGEIIATLDADCSVGPDWIVEMTAAFADPSLMLHLGPVRYSAHPSWWNRFYTLDFLALMIATEASVLLHRPTMANAANFFFRRDVLSSMNDAQWRNDLESGDDVFLLHSVVESYGPEAIRFNAHEAAIIETQPPNSLGTFLRQRLRWGSKGKHYKDTNAIGLSWMVFLTNISLLLVLAVNLQLALLMWILKILADYILLSLAVRRYGRKDALSVFIPQVLLYPWYLSSIAVASQMFSPSWKHRRAD